MSIHLQYLKYILKHKWYVFLAGTLTGAPLHRLLLHDLSKFRPSEWAAYANYFYKDSSDNSALNIAWLHHQRRNKHHWQYWYLVQDNGETVPQPMPESYVREMVADWAGAGKAATGRWDVSQWYRENKYSMKLHKETRTLVESILSDYFDYIPYRPA